MSSPPESQTRLRILLEQHHRGDPTALAKLVEDHYDAIAREVHHQLKGQLRREGDTGDFVNEIVIRILKTGPRFLISDPEHFRNLMVSLVRNALIDASRRQRAGKRDRAREQRMPTRASVVDLDIDAGARRSPTQPEQRAATEEEIELVQLALDMMPPEERNVLELRQQEMSFEEIAERIDLSAEGARKRYLAAVRRLQRILKSLQRREVGAAIVCATA